MTRFWHQFHTRLRRHWRGLLIAAGIFVLAGVAFVGVSAILLLRYGSVDRARAADVIVVLGGGPASTERRTRHAIELYHEGYAPYIVCSGGRAWTTSEADRCARRAEWRGVPPEAIVVEDQSQSTEENAIEVAKIMAARGWDSAIIVSDDFHLWRAQWLFEEQGVPHVWTSPADPVSTRDQIVSVVREVAAIGWHIGKSALGLPYTRLD